MAQRHTPKERDRQTKLNVHANFIKNGSSLHAYCEEKSISRASADNALLNPITKKRKALRSQLIQASKAKPTK